MLSSTWSTRIWISAFATRRRFITLLLRRGLPGFGGSKLMVVAPEYESVDRALNIVRLLAEPDRLRVVAAVVLGYEGLSDIARVSGVAKRTAARALSRLIAGGLLVQESGGRYRFASEELKAAAREVAVTDEDIVDSDAPPDAAKVLRSFVRGGQLTSIPAAQSKRRIVLDHLVQGFEPGRRYNEVQVNKELSRWHEDVAALRRLLVDEGFMDRERGTYWRIGGSFPTE